MDLVDKIVAYESNELEPNAIIELFAELVKTGLAYTLQGHYGRGAEALIEQGYIDKKGNVLACVLV